MGQEDNSPPPQPADTQLLQHVTLFKEKVWDAGLRDRLRPKPPGNWLRGSFGQIGVLVQRDGVLTHITFWGVDTGVEATFYDDERPPTAAMVRGEADLAMSLVDWCIVHWGEMAVRSGE